MTSRIEPISALLQRALPVGVLLLAWELVARTGLVNPYVFPPVSEIMLRWLGLFGDHSVYVPLRDTLWRALAGLLGAIVIGAPIGLLMGRTRWAETLFEPIFSFFFPLPKIALIPLYVHLFGLFSLSKVMLVFTDCLFPIVIFTYHGAHGLSPVYLWSAQARGTGRIRMFWRVVLPLSLASLYDGVQVAVVVAVLVAVVSEMVSGGSGLGAMMMRAYRYGDVRTAFATLVTISLIGFILYKIAQWLRGRLLFWHVTEFRPLFEYFPSHYSWNMGLLMAAQLGGEMSEIDEACRPLLELSRRPNAKDDPAAQAAWVENWSALARKIEGFAARDEAAGHALSAGRKYLRACVYWFSAERMAGHGTPQKLAMYEAMMRCFARGVRLRNEPIEFVDIPYEGKTLDALLYHAPGAGAKPAMIHFDGFDVTKEWMYLCGIAREFAARGISTLMVDHPGIGAALRLHGMAVNYDSERWAAAALDWLENRDDIDASRVGVVAMSLGGYYAPRAAAFEPRLAACVAWGARWDNAGSHGRILLDPNAARSITGWVEHALSYYGAATPDEAYDKIAKMTLEGIAHRITCPLLVAHGAGDRQVPLEQAERTVREAVNSKRAELRLFTAEEGGSEHVGGDLFSPTIDYIADWCADVLAPAKD